MSQFTKALSDLLKSKKITLYSLAKEANIDRTLLSKIVSGSRALTVDNFRKILETLSLLECENNFLKELYVSEYFGKEKLIENLKLLSLFSQSANHHTNFDFIEVSLETEKSTFTFQSRQELVCIIDAVMAKAVCGGKKFERIYLNFDSGDVLDVIKKHVPYLSDSNFKVLVCFDKLNTENLLEEAVKHTSSLYSVHYRIENPNSDLFPHFLIIDDYIVLADLNLKNGILIKNCEMSDIYAKKFLEAYRKSHSLVNHYDDIFECRNMYSNNSYSLSSSNVFFCFSNVLPCANFMTPDMWEQVARNDIPHIEYLKSSVYDFYSNFIKCSKSHKIVMPMPALAEFTRGGVIHQVPNNLTHPLSLENRLKIMKLMRNHFEKEENALYILKDNIGFSFDVPICFEVNSSFDGSPILALLKKDFTAPVQFVGNISIYLTDKSVCQASKELLDILSVSPYCYTQKESFKILDEEINRLEFELGATEHNRAFEESC